MTICYSPDWPQLLSGIVIVNSLNGCQSRYTTRTGSIRVWHYRITAGLAPLSYLNGRTRFVKLGLHQSPKVDIPQGSVVLWPLQCREMSSKITEFTNLDLVTYRFLTELTFYKHQYANDMQPHQATSVDKTAAGLSVLDACLTAPEKFAAELWQERHQILIDF